MMPRSVKDVHADFNGFVPATQRGEPERVLLDGLGSLCCLAHAGVVLAEGMRLTVYDVSDDDEDLEADGVAHFDATFNCWALVVEKQIRYVPRRHRETPPLICVACRQKLIDDPRYTQDRKSACPDCGTKIWTPLLPPPG